MRALFRGSLLALTPRCWGFARQGTASVSLEAQARLHVMVTVTITVDRTESSAAPLLKAGSHPAAQPVSQTALSPQPRAASAVGKCSYQIVFEAIFSVEHRRNAGAPTWPCGPGV